MASILPGIDLTVRDRYVVGEIKGPVTENVTIIGMALDGPINLPVRVTSLTAAEKLFGPLVYKNGYKDPVSNTESGRWSGNSLLLAADEARKAGAANITLVRVGGTTASATATGTQWFGQNVTVSAKYPGAIYNGTTVALATGATGPTIRVTQSSGKGVASFSVFAANAKSVADICQAVNLDVNNNTVRLTVPRANATNQVSAMTAATATLAGGTNGTRAPGDTYASNITNLVTGMEATDGTYAKLASLETSHVVLAGLYADDAYAATNTDTTSLVQGFASFLYSLHAENHPAIGWVGTSPTGTTTQYDLKTWAENNWAATTAGYAVTGVGGILKLGYLMQSGWLVTDSDTGVVHDMGGQIMICAGEAAFSNKEIGTYIGGFAAAAAGQCSKLAANQALTNTPVAGIDGIVASLPRSTMNTLVLGIGYNLSTATPGGGSYLLIKPDTTTGVPRYLIDTTSSKRQSEFNGLMTTRIVHLVAKTVQNVLQPFIGKAFKVEVQNSMDTQLEAALASLAEMECLIGARGQGFEFSLTPSGDGTYTDVLVDLSIIPVTQIRQINLRISVS